MHMATVRSPRCQLWCTLLATLLASIHLGQISCRIYRVGDLDSWGIPSSSNPQLYATWSKYHNLTLGDSLFFLYPPSQDSVIQVTRENYNRCNTKDPILYMNNGNSLFNITKGGDYYFTSGKDGHCEKLQKLRIFVSGDGSYVPDADAPGADGPSADAPSYPTVFGSIPVQAAESSASSLMKIPFFISAVAALILASLVVV